VGVLQLWLLLTLKALSTLWKWQTSLLTTFPPLVTWIWQAPLLIRVPTVELLEVIAASSRLTINLNVLSMLKE
jgi:hypothetical protein